MNTENQIPFSWDLFKQGKHDAQTRSGLKVTDLEDGYSWEEYPIKGSILLTNGSRLHGTAICWTKEGKFTCPSEPEDFDLFLVENEATNG